VARRIRELGLSIAGYAKQLGVGYMPISRFLSSGTPPENAAMRSAIQQDLGLSDEDFDEAMQSGSDAPKPGTVTVRAGEPPPDASPLQIALVNYMQANKLTIKGLSQRIGLSQITVSRLVKQGAQPSRTRTHQRLQSILGLGDEEYQDLVSADGGASRSAASIALQQKDGPIDDYTPSIEEPASRRARGDDDDYPTTDDLSISDVELMRLVKRLNRQQRATLATFLRTLLGS
jgi:transcriptional regulator with XRE-family HTH domain